jgi:hypothetical protein
LKSLFGNRKIHWRDAGLPRKPRQFERFEPLGAVPSGAAATRRVEPRSLESWQKRGKENRVACCVRSGVPAQLLPGRGLDFGAFEFWHHAGTAFRGVVAKPWQRKPSGRGARLQSDCSSATTVAPRRFPDLWVFPPCDADLSCRTRVVRRRAGNCHNDSCRWKCLGCCLRNESCAKHRWRMR